MSCQKCLTQASQTLQDSGIPPSLAGAAFSREGNGPVRCPDCGQFMSEEQHLCPAKNTDVQITPGDTLIKYMTRLARQFRDTPYTAIPFGVLTLADETGRTVAHEIAGYRRRTDFPKELLALADRKGWTVAHEMTRYMVADFGPEILTLADREGLTVAHIEARNGRTDFPPKILELSTKNGWKVAQEVDRYKALEQRGKRVIAEIKMKYGNNDT